MNFIGHEYCSYKILGIISPISVIGSHVNDLVPFMPNSVFSFEEIHESTKKIYEYTKEKNPNYVDFAIAMMIHSKKFGSDSYNEKINDLLFEKK